MEEQRAEGIKFESKTYTLKEGTTLFSGPYGESGEVIGHVEGGSLITSVFTDKKLKRVSSDGWIFFPTSHIVRVGPNSEARAWIAKSPGKTKGFVKI